MGSDVSHCSLELRDGAAHYAAFRMGFLKIELTMTNLMSLCRDRHRYWQIGSASELHCWSYATLFIAAIWVTSRPSFEKCSALENVTERNACYDGLRKELLKPPAKGADVPCAPRFAVGPRK